MAESPVNKPADTRSDINHVCSKANIDICSVTRALLTAHSPTSIIKQSLQTSALISSCRVINLGYCS